MTTVEFALVVPVFVLIMGIAGYFGWFFFSQTQVDRAASRAARYAAVPETDGTYSYCQFSIVNQLNADLYSGQLTSADVVISDGTGKVLTGTDTKAGCTSNYKAPQGFVKVAVTHDFSNPFAFITGSGTGLNVSGTGQVRVEHE